MPSAADIPDSTSPLKCGKDALTHFKLNKAYKNLNHGSFGTYPTAITNLMRDFQDQCEERPDEFIRYTFPQLLDESRRAIADYLHAPVETCVFMPNATTGINTVLRNLVYKQGDVIIYFDTIYGACEKTIEYLIETTPVESRKITYTYPISDDEYVSLLEDTILQLRAEGKHPHVAVFDTIVALPGIRLPFERLTAVCRKHDVLSCIDGAHGVGHIPLDLGKLDADFFVSNCHKWLFVPRGTAVFYVPVRNQHLMRSTLPTSHGFVPRSSKDVFNPFPPSSKSEFVNNFEFVGTLDATPYLCVPAALKWRSQITDGEKHGEDAIFAYSHRLAQAAGKIVSKSLGTEMLEEGQMSSGNCCFTNVRLPMSYVELANGEFATALKIAIWISKTLAEYGTFMALFIYNKAWWVRLSATLYVTEQDFEWAAQTLSDVCERAKTGEWQKQ